MFVRVKRCSTGSVRSPIIRLGQKLTTSTSSLFVPRVCDFYPERWGQTMPQLRPFTFTSASSRTSPRSRRSAERAVLNAESGNSNALV